MKDWLNRILMAAAGVTLAVTFAAVALAAGGGALPGGAGGGSVDAPLLAMVAGVLAAGVARGIRTARATSGGASRRAVAARGRRFGSLVIGPGL